MKKIVTAVLLLLLVVVTASASAERLTLIMYMCGSDLQEDCVTDMKEIAAARTGDEVNIVVLAGGAKSWPDSRLAAKKLNLFTVSGGSFSKTTDWGKGSMGDPATLRKYLTYALDTYPADRTMLVFWNHGGGTQSGVCFDEANGGDALTIAEIEQALSAVKREHGLHLDIVGFDACLMAGYEAAAMLTPYADYMIASEELEPGQGWYYTDWLRALSADPSMTTPDLCRKIVSTYQNACEAEDANDYYTLSAIDLSVLEKQLIPEMEKIAAYMADALNNRQLSVISRMRQRVRSYGYWYDASSDMIDLSSMLDICEQFAPSGVAAARSALADAVVVSYKSRAVDVASGLSIYVPMDTVREFQSDLPGYSVSTIPNYVDFVQGYAALVSGGSYVFSASAPVAMDSASVSAPDFVSSIGAYGFIPGATYSAEPSTGTASQGGLPITAFIPGTQNDPAQQTAAPQGGNASLPPFIAGTASGLQTVTDDSGNTLVGFIAGTLSSGTSAPVITEATQAFSLALSAADMENLSYVEGTLFMDLSDDEGVYLMDMGYLQNSWIDWEHRMVYSSFDGSWPTLDGYPVTMYDQSRTGASRRSLIPVRVNGKDTYLVVTFEGDSTTGRVLGYNAGFGENGLPIRHTTPLRDGDRIVPVYTMYCCDWEDLENDVDMQEVEIEGDPIIWNSAMRVTFESLRDEDDPMDFLFGFFLNDIFGDSQLSELIDFTL